MSQIKSTAILVIIVLLCALTLRFDAVPTLSSSTRFVAGGPVGYDPLTQQEAEAVAVAAQQAVAEQNQRAPAADQAASSAQEVLLVERHEASKADYAKRSWPRQGDVYVYDYATDTLIHSTVDVQSGAVITVEHVQGVQLPLTAREEQRALAIVQADNALWTDLAQRYQMISGADLQSIDQLEVKVSVFHADVMPDRLNAAAQQCGHHRCAQVLIFTTDKTLLEIMPIVDLSQGYVVQSLDEG